MKTTAIGSIFYYRSNNRIAMMPGDGELILRLVLASVLGALIGLEREVHGREAGIRTYLLVSLGSALIMVLSEYIWAKYEGGVGGEFIRVDPGRIAAQAITGIGFLGAGVIIRYKNTIRGLTTAACMWVTCGVGLAAGTGYYLYASIVTAITLFSLTGLKTIFKRLSTDWYRDLTVKSDEREGGFEQMRAAVERQNMKITNFSITKDRQKHEMIMTLRLRFHAVEPHDGRLVDEIYSMPGVRWVELR